MAKYLLKVSYSVDGLKGVMMEGGTSRVKAVERALAGVGGSLESFYFAFGDEDVYVITDLPDNASAAALALTVSARGSVGLSTTVLLSADEIDAATKKKVDYRPPGG